MKKDYYLGLRYIFLIDYLIMSKKVFKNLNEYYEIITTPQFIYSFEERIRILSIKNMVYPKDIIDNIKVIIYCIKKHPDSRKKRPESLYRSKISEASFISCIIGRC